MLDFKYYLKIKAIKRKTKDINLAKSLLLSAKDRMEFAKKIVEEKPRYSLELAYESVRELLDALLSIEGYKTWSHEAAISFLQSLVEFSKIEIERLDMTRKKRHSSKYYGLLIDIKECKDDLIFLNKLFFKLEDILKRKIGS